MASSHPQEDNALQPAEERELEAIANVLGYCRDHWLAGIDNLIREFQFMGERATINFDNALRCIKDPNLMRAREFLWLASAQFSQAKADVVEMLNLAQQRTRESLALNNVNVMEAFNRRQMQEVIHAIPDESIWRHISCRRANVALPPYSPGHEFHLEVAEFKLTGAINQLDNAKDTLDSRLREVRKSLAKTMQLLAPIVHRSSDPRDRSTAGLHYVLEIAGNNILATENIAPSFSRIRSALISIRESVINEAENDFPAMV